ncbi:MAG: HAD-IIIA family hydrolase [Candidatus Niyogibacteria bacterium]|nr:HAD-IIIA family hydrolase [Candidatus Niyogibacteria bacterium]
MRRAVFIDRDGVVNDMIDRGQGFFVVGKEVRFTAPYNLVEFRIKPNIPKALTLMGKMDLLRILVTNQPDLVYGMITKEDYNNIMAQVRGLGFDDIFVCYHDRDAGCECRKPKAGMLLAAAEKWNIDLGRSYMIGDTENDMLAGQAAGCKTVLIRTDYNVGVICNYAANNLLLAAKMITHMEKGGV